MRWPRTGLASDGGSALDIPARTFFEHRRQLFVPELDLPPELARPLERRVHIVVVGPHALQVGIAPRRKRNRVATRLAGRDCDRAKCRGQDRRHDRYGESTSHVLTSRRDDC
jgi:hypothetical protein